MKHSIARQLALIFIGMILLVMLANILVNTFFLERFYTYSLEKALIRMYDMIDGHVTEDGADREYFTNTVFEECSSKNMSLVIVDADYNVIVRSNRGGSDLMLARLNGYIIGIEKDDTTVVLKKQDHYTIQKKHEALLATDYLEMWGELSRGGYLMIRIPISSIRVNAHISNRFTVYVCLFAIVFCVLLSMALSKRITRPILELTDLSRRMADLDFDARYTSGGDNEIGQLGEHFNRMSKTLEETITALKSANNQLQLDIDRKTKIDQMRTEFLSNVSHELKTPLALIQGYAEGLTECVNDDEESRNYYCEVIVDEASKMNTLVQKLLTLNQLEFGNDQTEWARFDLAQLISGKIQSVSILLTKQKDAQILYEGRDNVQVWGDEFKVEEVLTNYLSNALNHLDGERKIIIREKPSGKNVRITVFNTGEAIPEEDIDRIWDKFYKVDKARTREYGGSGVGLSIVKAIMESMHQQYGVANVDGGVEFWFELESADAHSEEI